MCEVLLVLYFILGLSLFIHDTVYNRYGFLINNVQYHLTYVDVLTLDEGSS